ncbi:MlaA family lipoprotein [Methylomicrobium sp. RS1]|jgi:phospholipid-binding lipoprotein MlaA|uniref:MlaA family lipoprotein n=1 Tax=Candidatus Methylomicrobium oryzae TaxID=2802053 RepID=UPI001923008F|nr:VacJ family lipoprotein [Methylomicrobium sp. RS1]MBL1264161.1 VacJ family lipoprotein [Methylomicrobium sp. RS1]
MFTRFHPGISQALSVPVFLVASASILTGCASTGKDKESSVEITTPPPQASQTDPFEGFNRSMYNFNMKLDKYFFKPVSDGYKFITPDFVETGVSNFFNNLKGINVVLNDFLQGKFAQGASDSGRFLTNTTIGVVGLVDVASELGLHPNVEDFGQTLAVWGVGEGPYLVLPVMGPTTIRDGSGGIVDKAANPGTYVPFTGIIEGINDRAKAQGALNFIDEASLDPYVFTRESFLQHRRHLVNDGKTDIGHDHLDLDASFDNSADPKRDNPGAEKSVADASSKDPVSVKPTDKTASAKRPAYEAMIEAFEQNSAKVDRLSEIINR